MNNGDDTAYYLRLGYNVIAIDASPDLVNGAQSRFARDIDEKKLKILNLGIASEEGELDFYLNKGESAWNSFNISIGSRGDFGFEIIKVKTKSLDQIIKEKGVPYYLKIDIEGNDIFCLDALFNCQELPKYISVELSGVSLIMKLKELGYNQFKIIDQESFLPIELPAIKEYNTFIELKNFKLSMNIFIRVIRKFFGRFIISIVEKKYKRLFKYDHKHGSSGPFGEQLPGKWLTFEEVLDVYNTYKPKKESSGRSTDYSFWADVHANGNDNE